MTHLMHAMPHEPCGEALLVAGADPSARDEYGRTALGVAVSENPMNSMSCIGTVNGAKTLLRFAPQLIDVPDDSGETPPLQLY
jgi:ankyrin repeat protein